MGSVMLCEGNAAHTCVTSGGGFSGGGTWGHGWDSDAGGKGQAMQSICCADAKGGQLLGEIRSCCSSSLEASLWDCKGVNFL